MADATIHAILLDIEGTTCPVQFVSEVLFPYAAERLEEFLQAHGREPAVADLLHEVEQAWQQECDPAAKALRPSPDLDPSPEDDHNALRTVPYLQWLIQTDRKLPALKELQGIIWENGYNTGALTGPLYDDVAPALERWSMAGLKLAVYSSGSVKAQQLLYQHSNAGDLRDFFQHWFDTTVGSKLEPTSYSRICQQLQLQSENVLFVSDSLSELEAAEKAGLQVLFSDRAPSASPCTLPNKYVHVHSFSSLNP